MISMSFLLAQGLFSFYPFFIVSFMGTFSSDILWFLMGRTKVVENFMNHHYTNSTVSTIIEAVHKISRGSSFVALFLANFMLASRIILIMYVSRKNLDFIKFLYYEAIAVFFWLIAVISIGYFSGIGYTHISNILENTYAGIGFILLVFLVFISVQIWLKKRFTGEVLEEK